jgi:UDP-N-acetylmuramate: L-alanyl-gamma-D-glutamyl-meso-diaminopimelate ligase
VDIYPTLESYLAAFAEFVRRIPEDGVLVAFAGDPLVREVARSARCRVVFYALSTDDVGEALPVWTAAPIAPAGGAQPFDLFVGGTFACNVHSPLSGEHNVRNAIAAIALVCETSGGTVPVTEPVRALRAFRGVKRRQELRGEARGVRVYDDFAHHPTAVRETLAGLRARHPEGRLLAAFEPRSATACRKLHEEGYKDAFFSADLTVLAPLGRANIPDAERMDLGEVARGLAARGKQAVLPASLDEVLATLVREAKEGDTIVLMSNGAFGDLPPRLLASLATGEPAARRGSQPGAEA